MVTTTGRLILLVDDDTDDQQLAREALEEGKTGGSMRTVSDGEELLEYLQKIGRYASGSAPRPAVILLDLNMPRLDGNEALKLIKRDPDLRKIPIVVMTTSSDVRDIERSYDAGANSFVTKPMSFDELVKILKDLSHYWLEVVSLPGAAGE